MRAIILMVFIAACLALTPAVATAQSIRNGGCPSWYKYQPPAGSSNKSAPAVALCLQTTQKSIDGGSHTGTKIVLWVLLVAAVAGFARLWINAGDYSPQL